ncbi:MAG TPA: ABC-F family ATP-binding cassette domain-containing protein [Saprospiraceae bacterium]|nr:ABC-F family ATP-binding cassette domain-containing protein [Saprospiraceae bacterium]
MITISNLYLHYGDRVLFDGVSTTIQIGEKIGLTGRNGAGKSTLLKILAGEIRSFEGTVDKPKSLSVAYLHQDIEINGDFNVMQEALTAFEELNAMEIRINEVVDELNHRTDYESDSYAKLIDDISHLTEQFEFRGGNQKEANAERILKGLGFLSTDYAKKVNELSGGWQMRVELAKMLLTKPDYLLLDEPTNHLDIESIIWLENFLADYKGAVVLISHDKQFLDRITKRTIEIELGRLFDYQTNYSNYLLQRSERRELLSAAFENQQKVIAQREKTIARFMAKATKTSMAQSMQKQLNKMDRIELDEMDTSQIRLQFPPSPRSAEVLLDAHEVRKSYNGKLVFDHVSFRLTRGERVAFVGQNGMGKSTLAKILINQEKPDHGTAIMGQNTLLGYYAQNQSSSIDQNQTLLQVMENAAPLDMRTKVRSILGSLMFSGQDVDKKISVLSGGERGRLALALLLLQPINLLVLDEPTNHLDINAKDVLKKSLMDFDGTLLIISHDRSFLEGLTDRTIEFKDHTVKEYLGDINYFLDKRNVDNFRQVEQTEKQKQIKPVAMKSEVSRDSKAIDQVEKKISKLEKEMEQLKVTMGKPNFFESKEYGQTLKNYEVLQEELDVQMEKWESFI